MSPKTFESLADGVIIRQNLRDGIFQKRPQMYVSSFKVAVFGGSGEKITLNVRVDGNSSRDVKKLQFAFRMWSKTFESLRDGLIVRLNLRDGIFLKRLKMYVSSFKVTVFGGSGEKKGLIYMVTAFHHQGQKSSVRVRHVLQQI